MLGPGPPPMLPEPPVCVPTVAPPPPVVIPDVVCDDVVELVVTAVPPGVLGVKPVGLMVSVPGSYTKL